MPLNTKDWTAFQAIFGNSQDKSSDAIITPSSEMYHTECMTWALNRFLKPDLVLRPGNITELKNVVPYLYHSNLDFAVRNGGISSTSSGDVILTMSRFTDITLCGELGQDDCAIIVGAGALWGDVDQFMANNAKGYSVIGARTPFTGVTGTILSGGLSWLSHEYGMISDAQNLLDVEMILRDGRSLWLRDKEPDLLWTIRGGRSAFGVITAIKLRVRPYKTVQIASGRILFPIGKLYEVSQKISHHVLTNHNPKVAFNVFILHPENPLFHGPAGVGLMIFDAYGMTHARSKEGFKWAFDIEGANDETFETDLYGVNNITARAKPLMGKLWSFDVSGLVTEIDSMFLVRAKDWYYHVLETDRGFQEGSFFIIELSQKPGLSINKAAFNATGEPTASAWPHAERMHVLQLTVGFMPQNKHLKSQAAALLMKGFREIPLPSHKFSFLPNFIEPSIMELSKIYGDNYTRMKEIAQKHDPDRRFRSIFNLQKS